MMESLSSQQKAIVKDLLLLAQKLDAKLDDLWDSGKLNQETLDSFRGKDVREIVRKQ